MPKCSVGVKEGSGLGYLQGPEPPLSLVLTSVHWAWVVPKLGESFRRGGILSLSASVLPGKETQSRYV